MFKVFTGWPVTIFNVLYRQPAQVISDAKETAKN